MRTYFFFAFFLIATTHTFAVPRQTRSEDANNKNYELCTTKDCTDSATRIAATLDRTIDPCDNFYKFACGGWIANHPVNESYPITGILKVIGKETTEQIKDILEDTSKPGDTLSLGKARKLYSMCMDVKELKNVGISALNRLVQKNGGWPMAMSVKEWQIKGKPWQRISDIMMGNMFSNGLYGIIVQVDDKKSSNHVIFITEPSFIAPRDIVIEIGQDSEKRSIYTSLIEKAARIFVNHRGTYVNDAMIAQDANDIVDFEIELAKLTMSNEDSRDIDKIYNELTVTGLQQAYDAQRPSLKSKINWLNILQRLFAPERITIRPNEKLVVQGYKYLTNLVSLIERTSTRTIVNYMQWTFIRDLSPYAGDRMEEIAFEISKQFHGQPPDDSRWKICTQRSNLDTAVSHAYAKKYVQHENVEDINTIITDIKDVIRKQISASTWMDEATKKVSLDKLANMRSEISTPEWYSNEAIDKYYDGLIVTWEYFESIVNLHKYETRRMLRKLRKPVDKDTDDWFIQPTVVNAFHNPSGNAIVFTAAILQDPIYNKHRPAFMNYASLGFVIGHEINHGFDNLGRKYDKHGNSVQWWTLQTIDKYDQIAQCFIDQYNDYQVPDLDPPVQANGLLTLGENIGDAAGISAAYNAYKNRKAKLNKSEMRLPGLEEYSDDQVFFMNAAHTFCENATPEKIKLLLVDEHPRPEIRIRGSFSNLNEFSAAYNCPAEKGMNPEKKCALWQ